MGKPDISIPDLEQAIQDDIRKIDAALQRIPEQEQRMSQYKARIKKTIKKVAISFFGLAAVAGITIGIMAVDKRVIANLEQMYLSRISQAELMISNRDYALANNALDTMLIELSTSRVPSKIEFTDNIQALHENIEPIIEKQLEPYREKFETIKSVLEIDRIQADFMMQELKSSIVKENSQESKLLYKEIGTYDKQVLHPWLEQSYSILYNELDAKFSSANLEGLVGVYEESLSLLKNVRQSNSSLLENVVDLSGRIDSKLSTLREHMNTYQTLFYEWQDTVKEDYASSISLRRDLQEKLESETDMDVSYMLGVCLEDESLNSELNTNQANEANNTGLKSSYYALIGIGLCAGAYAVYRYGKNNFMW